MVNIVIIMVVRLDFTEKKKFIVVSFGWFFSSDTMAPLIRRTLFWISFGWPCFDYIILNFACDLRQQFVFHSSCFCHSFPSLPYQAEQQFLSYEIRLRSDFISASQFCCTQFNFKAAWSWQVHIISNHPHDTDSIFIYSWEIEWNRKSTHSIQ